MKKHLYFFTSLLIILSTISCNAFNYKYDDDLSFPDIKLCSDKLLNTDLSFICMKIQKGLKLIETNIKFNTNSFTLNDEAKEVLTKLYDYLKITKNSKFTIRGYAGKIDSKIIKDTDLLTEHNLRLSKNRAISVRDYLSSRCSDFEKIIIKSLGYQDPIALNDSNANRALNQRVEITLKTKFLK